MSISSLLNIGSRAMNASYAQLTVTGNNIANANTAGYSRQSVELETAFSQQTGNGFFGKGVNIATVTRAHSDFLIREAALAGSLAAGDAARSSQLSQLENVFRLGEAGLGYAAQQMFNAFVDVANRPQDSSARQVGAGAHRRARGPLHHRLRPARLAAGRRHRPAEERRRLDQFADDADRRPEPAASPTSRAPATSRTTCSTSATGRSASCRSSCR